MDKPIITQDFLFILPSNALIYPLDEPFTERTFSIKIKNFSNNFKFYSNLIDKNGKSIKTSLMKFLITPIVACHEDIITFKNKWVKAHFVQRGIPLHFPDQYLEDFFKIMTLQHKFWADPENTAQWVLLNAKNEANYQSSTHPENTLILNYWPTIPYRTALHAFSHENFHHWLGRKLHFPEDCRYLQWLIGGMTDYFGLLLAHESGGLDDESYIKNLNDTIRKYYTSPFRYLPHDRMIPKMAHEPFFQMLSLLRSHLSAYQINGDKIKPASETSLGEALKALKTYYNQSQTLSIDEPMINKIFSEHLEDKWIKMKHLIEGHQEILLPMSLLEGKAHLDKSSVTVPYFGFDLPLLLADHKIKDLDQNSPAYHAGLREGDIIAGHQLRLYNVGEPSEIFVVKNSQVKTISFIAEEGKPLQVPQYKLI